MSSSTPFSPETEEIYRLLSRFGRILINSGLFMIILDIADFILKGLNNLLETHGHMKFIIRAFHYVTAMAVLVLLFTSGFALIQDTAELTHNLLDATYPVLTHAAKTQIQNFYNFYSFYLKETQGVDSFLDRYRIYSRLVDEYLQNNGSSPNPT